MDNRLIIAVAAFRKELQRPEVKKMYIGFEKFPSGSCNDASILLGVYLLEQGYGQFAYTTAEDAKGKTHSWLQNEKLLIDITADQFGTEGIILKEITEENRDYFGYSITQIHPIAEDTLARTLNIDLINVYSFIKAALTNGF